MIRVDIGRRRPGRLASVLGLEDSIGGDLYANGRDAVEFYTRRKAVTARWA